MRNRCAITYGKSRSGSPRGVRRLGAALIAFALAAGTLLAPSAPAGASHTRPALPIVFVHGFGVSGDLYGSVAERFASNGYPPDRLRTFDWDSSPGANFVATLGELDNLIDQLRAKYGVDRVNLVAHSAGTIVAFSYLSDPSRAAKIAHYVGIDGPIPDPRCGVGDPNLDCMGIFSGTTGNVGGNNVYFDHSQDHAEAVTSPESFAAQYRFFTGEDPRTTLILPEPPGQVEIAGRAVNRAQNTGVDGGTLRIWEVNPSTGAREGSEPVATFDIGPSGDWGPVKVNGQKHYEFELQRPDSAVEENFYHQPFIRDDYWVRLLSFPPNSEIVQNTTTGPDHAAALVARYREWWTTHPSGNEDILRISTKSPTRGDEAPVNALLNVKSDGLSVGPIWIHVHDSPADRLSSLDLIPYFAGQLGQTGVDVYMPAITPPDGTITFWNAPRGDTSHPQVLNTPNWASDGHRIWVQFNDYVQPINTWGECKRAKPSPC
jgi:pimeloyl-ACP methyl ester carboxylesterase